MAEEDRPVKSGDKVKITGIIVFGAEQREGTVEGVIVSEIEKPPTSGPKDLPK
jgi:hypothetical protein